MIKEKPGPSSVGTDCSANCAVIAEVLSSAIELNQSKALSTQVNFSI